MPEGSNDDSKARLALNPSAIRMLTIGDDQHDRTPPVALDVAHPGDSFFVPDAKDKQKFRREISLYSRGAQRSRVRQTWVFGYVHRDASKGRVPDEKRRGWVPLRVLQ